MAEERGFRASKAARSHRGWTIAELVVVIAILGILATAAIPALRHAITIRQASAVELLLLHVRYAQLHALTTESKTWIVVDASSEKYDVYVEDPANPGKANRIYLKDPLTQSDLSVTFGIPPWDGVALASVDVSGGKELEFTTSGVPRDSTETALASVATITFGSGAVLQIQPETGHVSIAP